MANTYEHLRRRRFLAQLASLGCAPLAPACSLQPQPLRIGLHVWPGYEPMPLARELGWLDERHVQLVETGSATDSLRLLKEGRIDGAGLTLDEVLRARENDVPLSVLLVCDISAGADALLARPGINALPEIKGLRIGVEDGALGALMLHKVLEAANLEPGTVKPVPLTADRHVETWKRGDIDALITYEPTSTQIMKLGGQKLFDSRSIPDLILDVLAVRTSLLDNAHKTAVQHLLAMHLRALRHINTNADDAAYRLAHRFKLPPEQVLSVFRGLVLPDLDNNIRLLSTSRPELQKSASELAATLIQAGLLHRQASMEGLLRPEYLPEPGAS